MIWYDLHYRIITADHELNKSIELQWACYQGEGFGQFEDIDTVTMFADYRVPQVLVHFGALQYDDHLTNLLKSGKETTTRCMQCITIDLPITFDSIFQIKYLNAVQLKK